MGKIKKQRRRKRRREQRKEDLLALKGKLRAQLREQLDHKRKIRTKLATAKTDERGEYLADKADQIASDIARTKDRIESVEARLGKVRAVIRRLRKKIRRARKRLLRKKYYASKNFRYDEFNCNDGTPVPKAAYPALRHLCRHYLEPLREKHGSVYINSGYRHARYNARIGGAANSVHIYEAHPNAVAADHVCTNANPDQVASFHVANNPGGLGRYSSFTHIDNRQRIGWPSARWYGS